MLSRVESRVYNSIARSAFSYWCTEHHQIEQQAGLSVSQIAARARKHKAALERQGKTLDVVFIDHLGLLQQKHNVGIIIVQHDRKAEADNVFNTVSGSLGLSAAADTILVLKRQAGAVTLHIRGRDTEENETALQFNKTSCRWSILGAAVEVRRSAERNRVLEALRQAGRPFDVKDIQLAAELRTRNAADILLGKMVRDGEIVRAERGRYALPTPDGQITGETPHLKEENEVGNLSTDLSADLSNAADRPNLSDVSDLSGDRRGTRQTQLAMGASLASAMPVAPGKSNGRAPALGPPGDSLDDFL
jgi:hypothetical protein